MFNFFKKKNTTPDYPQLEAFEHKDHFFIRTATWDWLNEEQVAITDSHQPRVFTLDPWHQTVFLAANGQRTVKEFVHFMAGEYSGSVPKELDQTIINSINELISFRIISFSDKKQRPEEQFDLATSKRKV